MDPLHTAFLHSSISGQQFTDIYATLPQLYFEETVHGMKYIRTAKLPSGRTFVRVQEAFTPNVRSIADNLTPDRPHAESATLIGWWVPVDDRHTIGFHIEAVDPQDKEKVSTFARAKEGRTAGTQEKHRSYEDTQRHPDAYRISRSPAAMRGRRPNAVRPGSTSELPARSQWSGSGEAPVPWALRKTAGMRTRSLPDDRDQYR